MDTVIAYNEVNGYPVDSTGVTQLEQFTQEAKEAYSQDKDKLTCNEETYIKEFVELRQGDTFKDVARVTLADKYKKEEKKKDDSKDKKDKESKADSSKQDNNTYNEPDYSYSEDDYSYEEPDYSYEDPNYSYEEPVQSYEEPAQSYEEPAQSYEEPAQSSGELDYYATLSPEELEQQFTPEEWDAINGWDLQ